MKTNIKKLCDQPFRLNRMSFYRDRNGPVLASVDDLFEALNLPVGVRDAIDAQLATNGDLNSAGNFAVAEPVMRGVLDDLMACDLATLEDGIAFAQAYSLACEVVQRKEARAASRLSREWASAIPC